MWRALTQTNLSSPVRFSFTIGTLLGATWPISSSSGLEEGTDELDRVGVGSQLVRPEGFAPVEVVEGLNLVVLGSEQLDLGTDLPQRLARAGQLDFLDPLVGDEDRDFLALQLV
jgi:hypothetical protein